MTQINTKGTENGLRKQMRKWVSGTSLSVTWGMKGISPSLAGDTWTVTATR